MIKARWLLAWTVFLSACNGSSNDRGISLDELEKTQKEEQQSAPPAATHDALTAAELIELSDCNDLPCVQLFMKEHSSDFVHAKKGEFAALHRSTVIDTAGKELLMPLSTLYVETSPQANWRIAHTVHREEIGNQLLQEFHNLGFAPVDSGYFVSMRSKQARFRSPQYPGLVLYIAATYEPWYWKGLYQKVSWPCYVFEVYRER